MAKIAFSAPLLCLAGLATLAACQTNRSGFDSKGFPPDAAPVADSARPADTGRSEAAPSVDTSEATLDGQAALDGRVVVEDALLPGADSAEVRPASDGRPFDGGVVVPGDASLVETATPPTDSATSPIDTPPAIVDSAADSPPTSPDSLTPDTRRPDTRPLDTQLPDTRLPAAPLFDWPINSITRLGDYELTTNSTPTVTQDDPGTVVCFDGNNDGLVSPTNPLAGLAEFTLQLLLRPDLTGSSQPRVLYIGTDDTSRRLTLELRSNTSGRFSVYSSVAWDSLGLTVQNNQALHNPGEWIWLAITYDGQTFRLFVNGEEDASEAVSSPFGPLGPVPMSLGMRQNKMYFFPGCLARLLTHNVALAPAELQTP